jgi:hypothetical protein
MPQLLERAELLRDRPFGDWPAASVELVRSQLTATGAQHLPLASFLLGE